MICLVLAGAALAGLPPLSGFFSKELIMAGLAGLKNPFWLGAGLLGAFLTAYYASRVIFILLFPRTPQKEHQGSHNTPGDLVDQHHEGGYWVMAWPLIILAIITVLLGYAQGPLEHFLTPHPAGPGVHGGAHYTWLPYVALSMAAFGVGLAWIEFGRPGARQVGFVERIPTVHALFVERWYIDRFYRYFLDYVIYRVFSGLCTKNDKRVIDGSIDNLCKGTVETGQMLSSLHLGMIQYRMLVLFVVMALLALYYFF
jgi:NADH-quinone oxidoreductase subunit L